MLILALYVKYFGEGGIVEIDLTKSYLFYALREKLVYNYLLKVEYVASAIDFPIVAKNPWPG